MDAFLNQGPFASVPPEGSGRGVTVREGLDGGPEGLEELIDRINPESEVIGVGCMFSSQWPPTRDLLRMMRERFPEGANVGFVDVTGRGSINLRVFERGVGETAACGTGACAAVVTFQQLGLLDADVDVRLPGGQVVVSWHGGSEPVWLTGDAELVSEGFIDL